MAVCTAVSDFGVRLLYMPASGWQTARSDALPARLAWSRFRCSPGSARVASVHSGRPESEWIRAAVPFCGRTSGSGKALDYRPVLRRHRATGGPDRCREAATPPTARLVPVGRQSHHSETGGNVQPAYGERAEGRTAPFRGVSGQDGRARACTWMCAFWRSRKGAVRPSARRRTPRPKPRTEQTGVIARRARSYGTEASSDRMSAMTAA